VRTVRGARYALPKGTRLQVEHVPGAVEPLFWAADIVAGVCACCGHRREGTRWRRQGWAACPSVVASRPWGVVAVATPAHRRPPRCPLGVTRPTVNSRRGFRRTRWGRRPGEGSRAGRHGRGRAGRGAAVVASPPIVPGASGGRDGRTVGSSPDRGADQFPGWFRLLRSPSRLGHRR
jgi:hypothetical protein